MPPGLNRARFEAFAARKTREALAARIETLETVFDYGAGHRLRRVGNAWTRARYAGDFDLIVPGEQQTAVSLVFVQSSGGNTGSSDPSALGGGPTDTHLIYEGLSRVAADAVLAGAGTVQAEAFFSVWHPELVALRRDLGLPRHPAQIIVSKQGRLNVEALVFAIPDVPVFLIAGDDGVSLRAAWLRERPWIRHIPLATENLRPIIDHLRIAERIRRISAVGGRFTATRLVDHRLVQDLYLTTTSREAGEPGTPWYSGAQPPTLEVITRKRWLDAGKPVVFDHVLIAARS
jgi:riboflavin biosynthesis pyrimidine reductase